MVKGEGLQKKFLKGYKHHFTSWDGNKFKFALRFPKPFTAIHGYSIISHHDILQLIKVAMLSAVHLIVSLRGPNSSLGSPKKAGQ